PDGRVTTWSSLVNPGQPIPPEATAIHGISDPMVASAPTFAQLVPTVVALLTGCDLAGFNVERFDRRLLVAEFRRAGVEDPTAGARVIDAYTIFIRHEPRSLDAALRFYGVQEGQAIRQAHEGQQRRRGGRGCASGPVEDLFRRAQDGRRPARLALSDRSESDR